MQLTLNIPYFFAAARMPTYDGKRGTPPFGQLLIAESDGAADRRRVAALGVGEAGADGELRAVGQFDEQGAEPSLVPAGAGLMADDASLGVVE